MLGSTVHSFNCIGPYHTHGYEQDRMLKVKLLLNQERYFIFKEILVLNGAKKVLICFMANKYHCQPKKRRTNLICVPIRQKEEKLNIHQAPKEWQSTKMHLSNIFVGNLNSFSTKL